MVAEYNTSDQSETATMPMFNSGQDTEPYAGHILLAEDNKINIELFKFILERSGYIVDVATDGAAAVNAAAKFRYDLILMDMQMPIMDGVSATRIIRQREEQDDRVLIVAMTGNTLLEDRKRCLDAGMDDYLVKPFALQLLIETVRRWLTPDGKKGGPAPAVAVADVKPAIDEKVLSKLRAYMSPATFSTMTEIFFEQTAEILDTLARLEGELVLSKIEHAAHSTMMSFGLFGALQVCDVSTKLQHACRAGENERVGPLVAEFTEALMAAAAALRVATLLV